MVEPTVSLVSNEQVLHALQRGAVYVDVRTPQEFDLGHVPGAYNVPFQLGSAEGLSPNPQFAAAITRLFTSDHHLILGCHSGNRSARAAAQLVELGFTCIESHREGWDGCRDAFGQRTPGWSRVGYATEAQARPGHAYAPEPTPD